MAFWKQSILVFVLIVFPCIVRSQSSYTDLPRSIRFLDFNDYTNKIAGSNIWWHSTEVIGGPPRALLTGIYHTNLVRLASMNMGYWTFDKCRMGSAYDVSTRIIPPADKPPTTAASKYVATNLAVNLQNSFSAAIYSPVFPDGIGSLYFEAMVNKSLYDGVIRIEIATNMVDGSTIVGNAPLTNYNWKIIQDITLGATADFLRITNAIMCRCATKVKISRVSVVADQTTDDTDFIVVDNIRVSYPPSEVSLTKSEVPFSPGFPSVSANQILVTCVVSNVGPIFIETNAPISWTTHNTRQVRLHYRWRYLTQEVNPWSTTNMSYQSGGAYDDGLGNGEEFQVQLPRISDVGTLEYYFSCQFNGSYFQSRDYTAAIPAPNPGTVGSYAYPSENTSPRYLSSLLEQTADATNAPLSTLIRLFVSDYGRIDAMTDALGAVPMELVADNKWQARVNIAEMNQVHPGVSSLAWYFRAINKYNATQKRVLNTTNFWVSSGSDKNANMPMGGDAIAAAAGAIADTNRWMSISVDPNDSNHAIITFDTESMAYEAVRGEYQNFNKWISQSGGFADSDGYEPRLPYATNFTGWVADQFDVTREYFHLYLTNSMTFYSEAQGPALTMNNWTAFAAQYVSERIYVTGSPDAPSGITTNNKALRLLGGRSPLGLGYIQNNALTQSDGISNFTFSARAMTLPSLANVSYYKGTSTDNAWFQQNYLFRARVRPISSSAMSPGTPTLSMFAYYQDSYNNYEYRVTQIQTAPNVWDKRLRHQIIRRVNGVESILKTENIASDANLYDTLNNGNATPLEIRVYTTGFQTEIQCRFANTATIVSAIDSSSDFLTEGTCAIMASDCLAYFSRAWRYPLTSITDSPAPTDAAMSGGAVLVISDTDSAVNAKAWSQGAFEARTASPIGLYTVTPSTRIAVYAQPTTFGTTQNPTENWDKSSPVATYTLNSFAYVTQTIPFKNWGAKYLRIEVLGPASGSYYTDVAVDGLQLTSWHGRDRSYGSGSEDYKWSINEGWITSNTVEQINLVRLDISQANTNETQFLRSILLENGLGLVAVNYRVVQAPARLAFQYADQWDGLWKTIKVIDEPTTTTGWKMGEAYLGLSATNSVSGWFRVVNVYSNMVYTNGAVDIRDMSVWDEPARRSNTWLAYNALITSTDTNRLWIDAMWVTNNVESQVLGPQSCYLNNSPTNGVLSGYPQTRFKPYLLSPLLKNGIGGITFLARTYTTNKNATLKFQYTKTLWESQREIEDDSLWHDIEVFTNINNKIYRAFTWQDVGEGREYTAVRFLVETNGVPTPERVCLDEIVLVEPITPTLDIVEVKLLKQLEGILPVQYEDASQPLEGNSVDVQVRLGNLLRNPTNINVYLNYYVGDDRWGYPRWTNSTTWVKRQLEKVAGSTNMYRTTSAALGGSDPLQGGIVYEAMMTNNATVQYLVTVEYDGTNGVHYVKPQSSRSGTFVNPSWYFPVDKNHGLASQYWNPYYIVYDVPVGAVWINEVNAAESANNLPVHNPYIEIAIPSWYSRRLSGWTLEFVTGSPYAPNVDPVVLDASSLSYLKDAVAITNGYAFFLISTPQSSQSRVLTNQNYSIYGLKDKLFPLSIGGIRLRRPAGMYEQTIAYNWDGNYVMKPWWAEADPEGVFRYIGMEDWDGSLSFMGHVTYTIPRTQIDSTNTWYSGVTNFNWTPGEPNMAYAGGPRQIMPDPSGLRPGVSNVLITSYLNMLVGSTIHASHNGQRVPMWSMPIEKGRSTNVAYLADDWYRINSLKKDGVQLLGAPVQAYTVPLSNLQTNVMLSADVGFSSRLENEPTLDQSILDWLQNFPESDFMPTYLGVPPTPSATELDLVTKYWLDADPTKTNFFEFVYPSAPSQIVYVAEDTTIRTNIFLPLKMQLWSWDSSTTAYTNRGFRSLNGGAVIKLQVKIPQESDSWFLNAQYEISNRSLNPATRIGWTMTNWDHIPSAGMFRWYLSLPSGFYDTYEYINLDLPTPAVLP